MCVWPKGPKPLAIRLPKPVVDSLVPRSESKVVGVECGPFVDILLRSSRGNQEEEVVEDKERRF